MMECRNICIVAHVDHGKTTLVDHLLKQSGALESHKEHRERLMDSMSLEQERGITIQAKNASFVRDGIKVNVIDTPGHVDFSGEVERIVRMADGALLLVDAAEGPLPQTRFVLQRAIQHGLQIILVINKVDRSELRGTSRIAEVVDATFDLFCELGANDAQLDFPIIYACARKGWCTREFDEVDTLLEDPGSASLAPLFDLVQAHIPSPRIDQGPFCFLVSDIQYSPYLGRLAFGRVRASAVKKGQQIYASTADKDRPVVFTVTKLLIYSGVEQQEVETLEAGDLGLIAGFDAVQIGDCFLESAEQEPLPRIHIEPPTLGMLFAVNSSPGSGGSGEAIKSRKFFDRLQQACLYNAALRLERTEAADQFRLLGRGELQFAILMEQLRREGLEFMVGRPQVLLRETETGVEEPFEKVTVDLPESSSGDVTSLLQQRKGVLQHYANSLGERVQLQFTMPVRGLLGIRSLFLTLTRGEGLISSEFLGYQPFAGSLLHRINGALIADRSGACTEYGLNALSDRGKLFVGPGTVVYEGMVIGESARDADLNVNPTKEKKLTNVRAAGSDGLIQLAGITKMPMERCLEWIDEDEWIEVTPAEIRIRKKLLEKNLRSTKRRTVEN